MSTYQGGPEEFALFLFRIACEVVFFWSVLR